MWPHVLSVAARDAALIELHGDGAGVAVGVDHSAVLSAHVVGQGVSDGITPAHIQHNEAMAQHSPAMCVESKTL